MARYSEEFKTTMVRKALLPVEPRAAAVAEDAGISRQTLYNWPGKIREEMETPYGFIRVLNRPEYRDLNPAEVVAILAENRHYIGSERTIIA